MKTQFFRLTFFLLICVSIPLPTRAQTVNLPDPNLRAVIESALRKASGDPITVAEMGTLTRLEGQDASISDLTGLEFATNLTRLYLWDNSISDISPVAGLTNLTKLSLGRNAISDISPVAGLINLTRLDLWDNSISDISPVAGLTNLTKLFFGGNSIPDISPVAGLTKLIELDLRYNSIPDISPIAGLTNLIALRLSKNSVSDISPVAGLTNLTSLFLGSNLIADISAAAELTSLTQLYLDGNSISDISPLAGLTNLTMLSLRDNAVLDISAVMGLADLKELDLGENSLSDISATAVLTKLTLLYLGGNSISDISPVAGLTHLTDLDLEGNSISDISPVAGLTHLTWLYLANNSISDISAVTGLTHLTWLSLGNNSILDVSALVANTGLGYADEVELRGNPLSYPSLNTHIPILKERRVKVIFRHRTPSAILKISGYQRGSPSVTLKPFVVEVRDEYGSAFGGVPVTFAVTAGDGRLSATDTTTDENGRAQSTLTLGENLGIHTVSATAAGWVIDDPVIFNVISDTEPPPIATDVNDDGVANLLDLVLVASAFGSKGPDIATDVNGDGVVNISDLVWVADAFEAAETAPSAQALEMLTAADVKWWLSQAQQLDLTDATSLRGILFLEQLLATLIPKETVLLLNYPNPFNPETWIPYNLAKAADVTLTIYDTSGQAVRQLAFGHQPAGIYQTRGRAAYWDGKNEFGEPVASGPYFYTLTAGDYSATRKMTILK